MSYWNNLTRKLFKFTIFSFWSIAHESHFHFKFHLKKNPIAPLIQFQYIQKIKHTLPISG